MNRHCPQLISASTSVPTSCPDGCTAATLRLFDDDGTSSSRSRASTIEDFPASFAPDTTVTPRSAKTHSRSVMPRKLRRRKRCSFTGLPTRQPAQQRECVTCHRGIRVTGTGERDQFVGGLRGVPAQTQSGDIGGVRDHT